MPSAPRRHRPARAAGALSGAVPIDAPVGPVLGLVPRNTALSSGRAWRSRPVETPAPRARGRSRTPVRGVRACARARGCPGALIPSAPRTRNGLGAKLTPRKPPEASSSGRSVRRHDRPRLRTHRPPPRRSVGSTQKRTRSRSRKARAVPSSRGLRTKVSCSPRSQGPTRKGPLPIGLPVLGLSIRSVQTRARSRPEARAGKDDREEVPPACEACAEHDPHASSRRPCGRCTEVGGRIERGPSTSLCRINVQREDEVARGYRNSVAPTSFRTNVVREHERRILVKWTRETSLGRK